VQRLNDLWGLAFNVNLFSPTFDALCALFNEPGCLFPVYLPLNRAAWQSEGSFGDFGVECAEAPLKLWAFGMGFHYKYEMNSKLLISNGISFGVFVKSFATPKFNPPFSSFELL
jgi:hypothetical protein